MTSSPPSPQEVQKRSQRYASLRRAQRALSELAHPSQLESAIEQGRALLIELQSLSMRVGSSEGRDAAAERAALARVDQKLDELAAVSRTIVDRCSISQLRLKLQTQAAERADEILGVVDVVLGGDLESEKNLRLLEYLMTLLCSESRDGYVQVHREPALLVPELGRLSRALWGDDDAQCAAAERTFSLATTRLVGAEAVGPVRDSMRAFKRTLGIRILHPQVLSAVIHYNAVMSNRVAGLVEGSRSIDRLADDLLTSPEATAAIPESDSIFDSAGFNGVLSALAARLCGADAGDTPADRVALACDVGLLRPDELEAFEGGGEDHAAFLVRAAVTLGLVLRAEAEIGVALAELEIDPSVLRGLWPRELAREMTGVARKILAEARYTEASRLSEIKARHLAVAPPPEQRKSRARTSLPPGEALAAPERSVRLDPGLARTAIVVAGLLVFALALWPMSLGPRVWSEDELAILSEKVESGYVSEERWGSSRFVGTLQPGWDGLGAEARRVEATAMAAGLRARGVWRGVLIDGLDRVQVRIHDGSVVELASPSGSGSTL